MFLFFLRFQNHLFDYAQEQVPGEQSNKYCAACGKYENLKHNIFLRLNGPQNSKNEAYIIETV